MLKISMPVETRTRNNVNRVYWIWNSNQSFLL